VTTNTSRFVYHEYNIGRTIHCQKGSIVSGGSTATTLYDNIILLPDAQLHFTKASAISKRQPWHWLFQNKGKGGCSGVHEYENSRT